MPLLDIENLKVTFTVPHGRVEAVDGVSFSVPLGRTVALVGESGSGKSVVSQTIMGLLPGNANVEGGAIQFRDPESPGKVLNLLDIKPGSAAYRRLRGGRMALVFQEPMTALSPLHTIGDQIGEAHRIHGGPGKPRTETAAMLHRVGFPHPESALDRYPFELSGGLRQRAVIAMALVCRPALLIADEPTTALDVTLQAQILKLLKDLQAELNMGVLFISHDLGVVANIADEMVVMHRGRVMERGPAQQLLNAPRHPYLKGLMQAVPEIHPGPPKRLVSLREVSGGIGGYVARHGTEMLRGDTFNGVLMEVLGLVKTFGARRQNGPRELAVNGVSFDIRRGECLGLVGESGSGKSTVAKLIMRAFPPDLGTVRMMSAPGLVDVLALGRAERRNYRRRVQYVFQDPFGSLNPRMTVFDILREPLEIHCLCPRSEQRERISELIRLVGLDPSHLNRYPHSFSGGQRQRIGIARALALGPELLLLDEPVSALDVSVQAQILNLLKDLKQGLDLTYLFVSHNLAVIDYMADRIAVMCRGRIVELAPRAALFARPCHPYTKALLAAVPRVAPDARLDLTALMAGRASDPAAWDPPFTLQPGEPAAMVAVDDGHFVGMAWRHRQDERQVEAS